MFLIKRLVAARQPIQSNSIFNLAASFRSLHITQSFKQRPELDDTARDYITPSLTEKQECDKVFQNVNQLLASKEQGRLFAVVHLCGKQFKITEGDIILVEGYWPPTISDQIRLEKVLLAGGKDFTLIGRPIIDRGLVNVKATIIEKTLTHTKTIFKKKRRKQFQRINFQRSPNTMIRINSIEIEGKVNQPVQTDNSLRIF